jgi:hypothetical protein
MRDNKSIESFLKEKDKQNKQKILFKNLKKEVEIGANGTQKYVIKQGINKGKVANKNIILEDSKLKDI